MNKKAVGLAGALAISSLATNIGQAAAATPVQPAASRASAYADLLQPIPNASQALKLADEAASKQTAQPTEVARYSDEADWHRRHHRHHHHHHHHHHNHDRQG